MTQTKFTKSLKTIVYEAEELLATTIEDIDPDDTNSGVFPTIGDVDCLEEVLTNLLKACMVRRSTWNLRGTGAQLRLSLERDEYLKKSILAIEKHE